MPASETSLGLSSVQELIDYEKARGMQWITVKCGDGGSAWTQFNTDLVTRAHNSGLKIFGWAYAYGNDVPGEINVALNALNLGADGFIIDAEIEYETNANNTVSATQYCEGIRSAYPNRFLAHAPFPIISSHSRFPYITFGKYCDAVMPQAYWADIGGTNYAITMVTRMNTEWRSWQNALSGSNTNAIKPIVPIGQGYNSVNGSVDGSQITAFINALKTNSPSASAAGYKGVSFWSCQHHAAAPEKWSAIAAAAIGDFVTPPYLVSASINRSLDAGTNLLLSATAAGAPLLSYQWFFNGAAIAGAQSTNLTLTNLVAENSGDYLVVVTNTYGRTTGSVAHLVVNPSRFLQLIFSDDLDTDTSTAWNLFQGSGNGIADYTTNWAFDYSTYRFAFNGVTNPIPPSPHAAGTTRGLKLTVNKNDGVPATSAVSLYPRNQIFSGNYVLRCDVWLNYNGPSGGGSGSTEFATFGLNHAGTGVNWSTNSATTSDGLWFVMDGEAGSGIDYRAYAGNGNSAPTQLSSANSGLRANGALSDSATDPFFQNLFPGSLYETPGAPGKHWVEAEVSQLDGLITWRLNGVVVAQRTNTTAYTNGTIMIGYMDIFTSIANPAADNFVLFDNVRVYSVIDPPAITAQPANRTVNAGANAMFSVSATGTAPLDYQWIVNGTNVPGANASVLTISNTTPAVAGTYLVRVSNAAGSVVSQPASLSLTQIHLDGLSLDAGGIWQITLSGAPGENYFLETSTNLVNWQPLPVFVNSNGVARFGDAFSTNSPIRFYRGAAPR